MPQVDYLDERSDDGMGEQIIDYPQGQVDPQAMGEYLANQPSAMAPQNDFNTQPAPNDEFMMRPQPNEFVPMKQQQQQQHQQQPPPQPQQQLQPNEFIGE